MSFGQLFAARPKAWQVGTDFSGVLIKTAEGVCLRGGLHIPDLDRSIATGGHQDVFIFLHNNLILETTEVVFAWPEHEIAG